MSQRNCIGILSFISHVAATVLLNMKCDMSYTVALEITGKSETWPLLSASVFGLEVPVFPIIDI